MTKFFSKEIDTRTVTIDDCVDTKTRWDYHGSSDMFGFYVSARPPFFSRGYTVDVHEAETLAHALIDFFRKYDEKKIDEFLHHNKFSESHQKEEGENGKD